MDASEALNTALASLPCPVSAFPGAGGEAYVAWQELDGSPSLTASNAAQRYAIMVQVNIYTKTSGNLKTLRKQALALLKAAGFRIQSWGPRLYEADTKYHQMPITCWWAQKEE